MSEDIENISESVRERYLFAYNHLELVHYCMQLEDENKRYVMEKIRLNKQIDQLQQKENIIKEVREYIEEHKQKGYRIPMSDDYDFWNELNENEIKELLEILDKGKRL